MALNLTELAWKVDEAFSPQYSNRMKKRYLLANYNLDKIPSDMIDLCLILYFDINTIIYD